MRWTIMTADGPGGERRRRPLRNGRADCQPSEFRWRILALDIAAFLQTLPDGGHDGSIRSRRRGTEKSHHRHRTDCCARGEWPCCRAAEQRDELAPPHSITASASASNDGGTSRPRAFAALRFSTSSNLVAGVDALGSLFNSGSSGDRTAGGQRQLPLVLASHDIKRKVSARLWH